MKPIKYFSMILAVLCLSACTDLDLQPLSDAAPEAQFKDESSYKAFLAKLYGGLAVTGQQGPAGANDVTVIPDEGFTNYIRLVWQMQELPTDEAVIAWGDDAIQPLNKQDFTSGNQFLRAMFFRVFFQVSMANEFLRESTTAKLDSRGVSAGVKAEITAYRAEARFLRALSYWHGLDIFGNIPWFDENFTIGSVPPDQVDRATIFKYIEDELKAIENDMVAPGQNQYGRADRAALWALQAKLYLNAESYGQGAKYADCVAACKKIIDSGVYSLEEQYTNLFRADNHRSKEIIFAVTQDGRFTKTWGGTTFLVNAPILGSMNDNFNDATGLKYPEGVTEALVRFGVGGGWNGIRTRPEFVDKFPETTGSLDKRGRFQTVGQTKAIDDLTNAGQGYGIVKFINLTSEGEPGSDTNHPDTDYPMFRLADVYLMYAEAVLRGGAGGDQGTALNYVNLLRRRAYGNNTGNITAAQLNLNFILDERARELYWEGHRRTDLIRFNQFTENGVWSWKGGTKAGRTTSKHLELYPLPSEELIANPKLKQNQGY